MHREGNKSQESRNILKYPLPDILVLLLTFLPGRGFATPIGNMPTSAILRRQPDDYIDPCHPHTCGSRGQVRDGHAFTRYILDIARPLEEEVVMVGRVGVEIGPARFDHDF